MRSREHLQVLFAALDVAYRAKDGRLDRFDVDTLQSTAEQVFTDHTDPAFRAISAFATAFQTHRYDAAALAQIGEQLRSFVDNALMPLPPGQDRADIHG